MKTAPHAHIFTAAASHAGMSGKQNEDRYSISSYYTNQGEPVALAIVADGVGGHLAGEIAAEIAVERISQILAASDGQNPPQLLDSAIRQASEAIKQQAADTKTQRGMGATSVCAVVKAGQLFLASVGDSRIYLLRKNRLRQLTTDHTWVQEAIEHGALTPEQARNHPNANVIRRYLGSNRQVEPDFRLRLNPEDTDEQMLQNQGLTLLPNDVLILCSDGLTEMVSDEEIRRAFIDMPLQNAVDFLVDLANDYGGKDNITLLGLQIPTKTPALKPPFWKNPLVWIAGFLLFSLLCIGTLLAGGILFWLIQSGTLF